MHHFQPKSKIIAFFYIRNIKLSKLCCVVDHSQIAYRVTAIKHRRIIHTLRCRNNNPHFLAAFVYFFICSICKTISRLLHKAYLLSQLVREPDIVTVKECDIITLRRIYRSVARRRRAEIDIGFKQMYSVVVCCHTAHRVDRTVRRIVIGNDKLPILVGLILHGSYALCYVIHAIIRRHYD